jgi:hypothetical protein
VARDAQADANKAASQKRDATIATMNPRECFDSAIDAALTARLAKLGFGDEAMNSGDASAMFVESMSKNVSSPMAASGEEGAAAAAAGLGAKPKRQARPQQNQSAWRSGARRQGRNGPRLGQ